MRSKKSIKNLTYGFILQFITAIAGFASRTVLIKCIGIEAQSLNSLFTEVLSMLSLAELGIGAAITYSLYEPLAEGDEDKICRLMNLFSKTYKIVGAVILIVGLILAPFIQFIVNEVSYPVSYIRIIYILFVFQTASSYLFSYMGTLITADQKRFVVSLIAICIKVFSTVSQIIIVLITRNFIAYLCVSIAFNLLNNIILSIAAKRLYPYISDRHKKLSRAEERKIFVNVKDVFVAKMSGVITNSTDNTLISVLVGTISVGLYSNYSIFIGIIKGLLTQLTNAITASFGNLLSSETGEYCDVVLRRMTYMTFVFGGVCLTGMYCVLSEVVEFWLGKEYLLPDIIAFTALYTLFINIIRTPLWTMSDVSGMFKENSYTGILGSIVNLAVSVIFGIKLGMTGIFIGTICTYLIQGYMKVKFLYKRKLKKDGNNYYLSVERYLIIAFAQTIIASLLCKLLYIGGLLARILLHGTIAIIVSICFDIIPFLKTDEWSYSLNLLKRTLQGKHLI